MSVHGSRLRDIRHFPDAFVYLIGTIGILGGGEPGEAERGSASADLQSALAGFLGGTSRPSSRDLALTSR
jgi:hypothetical protein